MSAVVIPSATIEIGDRLLYLGQIIVGCDLVGRIESTRRIAWPVWQRMLSAATPGRAHSVDHGDDFDFDLHIFIG